MLSDAGSYAFGLSEHCFQNVRALLLDSGSNAFDYTEHASIYIQSTAPDDTEQCSDEYKDMFPCYYSTMTRPPMGWRVTRAWPFWSTFRVFFTGVGQ